MNDKTEDMNSEKLLKNRAKKKKKYIAILITFGSVISIAFGIWHFFVPGIWNWYSFIDSKATELIIAVRAINIFFSLLLVLLGIANILFVFRAIQDRFSTMILFSISTILWATRLILQLTYPQGSQNPVIQYSMLFTFTLVLACFAISLFLVVIQQRTIEMKDKQRSDIKFKQ